MLLSVGGITGVVVVSSNLLQNPPDKAIPGKLVIRTVSGSFVFIAPIAPKEVQYKANGVQWSQTARPNLAPITTSGGVALKVITMTLNLWSKDYESPIDDQLLLLESLANTTDNLRIEYERRTAGEWNITALDYSSVERQAGTNFITRANVNIEFTQAVKFTTKTLLANNPTPSKVPHVHTVKAGETFQSIANDFHMTWQKIADYNKINGKSMSVNMLKPGVKVKIP